MKEEIEIIHDSCPAKDAIVELKDDSDPSNPVSVALVDCKKRMIKHFGRAAIVHVANHYKDKFNVIFDAEAASSLTTQIDRTEKASVALIAIKVEENVTAEQHEVGVDSVKELRKELIASLKVSRI